MAQEHLKKFSEELKKTREEKDFTLQHIKNKTKIDLKFLQSIEQGNFEVLPTVYIRAFIKEYARAIELDEEETLKKFENAQKGKVGTEKQTEGKKQPEKEEKEKVKKFDSSEPIEEKKKSGREFNPAFLVTIGAIVVIIIVAVYFLFINGESTDILVEKSFDEVVEGNDKNERFEVIEEEPKTTLPQETLKDSLVLQISSNDTCWIGVTADDALKSDFIMYPDRKKNIKALNTFELVIGNAGGISFILNGEKLNFDGKPGQRRTLKITADGIVDE